MPPLVSDPKDVRVLIPRMRRALDGPHATGSAAVSSTMNDDELTGVIADAISDVVLFTGTAFGKDLEVVARDDYYLAPTEWQTTEPLTEPEISVITAQAALNYFYRVLSALKTSVKMADEGQEWQYSVSAQAVAERIKGLRADRDAALARIDASELVGTAWESFIAVRDVETAALIEPWVFGAGYGGGQTYDARFGTPY